MKRSPLLVYVFLWLTIGFYAVYWFLDSLRFLNGFRPVRIFNIRRLAWIVGAYLAVYIAGLTAWMVAVYAGFEIPDTAVLLFGVLWLMALFWNGFFVYAVWKVAWRIREVQLYEHLADPISPAVAVMAIFLWFLCFPYMQHHINIVEQYPTLILHAFNMPWFLRRSLPYCIGDSSYLQSGFSRTNNKIIGCA